MMLMMIVVISDNDDNENNSSNEHNDNADNSDLSSQQFSNQLIVIYIYDNQFISIYLSIYISWLQKMFHPVFKVVVQQNMAATSPWDPLGHGHHGPAGFSAMWIRCTQPCLSIRGCPPLKKISCMVTRNSS